MQDILKKVFVFMQTEMIIVLVANEIDLEANQYVTYILIFW